jgi:ParB family chromosome partitioning protein
MASRVSGKIKLTSVNELLCVPETAGTVEIELGLIHEFKNHPFKVVDDEKMEELVESIREQGILTPVLVRPEAKGGYEMISGHRRMHAAGIVGLKKIPAIVQDYTDDEATIAMVNANMQREEILPSERAFAFKMKMDALRHQGACRHDVDRTKEVTCRHDVDRSEDNACRHDVDRLEGDACRHDVDRLGDGTYRHDVDRLDVLERKSSTIVGKGSGLTGRTVQRYIRLTELIPELLEMVDNKRLSLVNGVEISYFSEDIQRWIYEYIKDNGSIRPEQIAALKEQTNLDNLTQFSIIAIMNGALKKKAPTKKVSFTEKKLNKYFPEDFSASKRERIIINLLEKWKEEQGE